MHPLDPLARNIIKLLCRSAGIDMRPQRMDALLGMKVTKMGQTFSFSFCFGRRLYLRVTSVSLGNVMVHAGP